MMVFGAYLNMLRLRNWLGYFLIATLGYAVFTKFGADVWDTVLFYLTVFLYLGFSFSTNNCFDIREDLLKRTKNNPVASGELSFRKGVLFSLLLGLAGVFLCVFRGLNVCYFFSLMVFLAFFYSAPPLRLKSRPVLDAVSHGLFFGSLLFLFPCVFFSEKVGEMHVFVAVSLFCFSVILELRNHMDDYESDKKAGLKTTVCALGLETSGRLTYSLSLLFPLLLVPVFLTMNASILFSFLVLTTVFYITFLNKKSYRILDAYSNFAYLLVILGALL